MEFLVKVSTKKLALVPFNYSYKRIIQQIEIRITP